MELAVIQDRAPEKPRHGEPCNGCGYCCAAEVCTLGQAVYGEDQPAPCPAMRFRDGRFWCGVVEKADEFGLGTSVKMFLGIGVGCDSDDPGGD